MEYHNLHISYSTSVCDKMKVVIIFYGFVYIWFEIQCSEEGTCDRNHYLGLASIYENQPPGIVIYNYSIFANSSDITSVTTNFPSEVQFNLATRQLVSLISFNRLSRASYSLELTVSCGTATAIYTQKVVIEDINNNPAYWIYGANNYYGGIIKDNSAIGTAVTFDKELSFDDLDSNKSHSVALIDPLNQNDFFITSNINYSPVIIANSKVLNNNIRSSYNLTLFLMDFDPGTKNARFNVTALVYIVLNATNAKPPIFEHNNYQFEIYNNVSMNSLFTVIPKPLKATNADIKFNTAINYKFSAPYSFLSLDPATGVLRLINSAIPRIFMATIVAYQSTDPSIQTSISVQISILSYTVSVPVKFSQPIVNVTILETMIGVLVPLNCTYNQNNPPHFSVLPPVKNLQISSIGLVMVTQRFYYSIQTFYNLTINASDSSTMDQMTLLIYLIDVNEQQPIFSNNYYNFIGNLSTPLNTFVIQVVKYDVNTYLLFKLEDQYGIFTISNSSNLLYLSVLLSKTSSKIYYLSVSVTETGQPPLSNSVNITVDFTNVSAFQSGYLPLYILLPIILLLILLLPIILCYYKKRRIYKATGFCLGTNAFNGSTDSFHKQWSKSSDINENVFNLSYVYNSNHNVGQQPKHEQDTIENPTFEKRRKTVNGESTYTDLSEMKELTFPNNFKTIICKDTFWNAEKIITI